MQLSFINNDPILARQAQDAGIERIFIDLEKTGKVQRQQGKNLFLSDHIIDDIKTIKANISTSTLMVRINPLDHNSKHEIDQVILHGADYIMLPYFHNVNQALEFCDYVAGRTKTVLLVETMHAANAIRALVSINAVDEIHIGLNDLCLSMNSKSIFEPIYNGMLEALCNTIKQSNKPYGFGGIGSLSNKNLPIDPEKILVEHIRLDCSIGWLGQSFRNYVSADQHLQLQSEVNLIRQAIASWQTKSPHALEQNKIALIRQIQSWEETLSKQLTI